MKKPKDLIDELLAGCKTPADIAGENGLLKQLTKAIIEGAMIALVSCFSNPFSPAMSAGVLQPASNSSIKSFGFFIRSPSISEDRLHKMIYTLPATERRDPSSPASR